MNAICATNKGHRMYYMISQIAQHPLKVIQRQAYWNGIQTYNQSLHDFMATIIIEPNQTIRVATGMIKLNSHKDNEFLIRNASLDLCNLCYYPS
jgi:hypothetical protein